jgi:hypothetical protein
MLEGQHLGVALPRGSGATWAATTGPTVAELMNRLGHATPTFAMRYQHATFERDQAIASKLGALLRAAGDARTSDESTEVGEFPPAANR